MKKMNIVWTLLLMVLCSTTAKAQGWPANYDGVMLQGFYWDSYADTRWTKLEKQAKDLAYTFNLVWVPQSGNCGGTSMGYDDLYWFTNYDSSFGVKEELLSMIKTFKDNGIGTIADVVINHRRNTTGWFTFPKETYNGVTYQLTSTDICADDDGGATATEAKKQGVTLSSNNDTGEGWGGMRDLDHKSQNVQTNVKAYLKMLLGDFGYAGFRYDMVRGYSAEYTGMYNADSKPTYSVGEYWDGQANAVKNWINGTKVNDVIQSAAFDFPFRYTVRDAINNSNWQMLRNASVMADVNYRRYAVTFVENHDTEYRSAGAPQDPIKKDTLAANAFMLAMPGTPSVFLKHWQAYKSDIRAMVEARRAAGIHSQSTYTCQRSSARVFVNDVAGTKGHLLVVIGQTASHEADAATWTPILSGYHYAYYLDRSLETAWADKGSGLYEGALKVKLVAVSKTDGAQLVYTTDGSTPTASSPKVNSGSYVVIPDETTTTLRVGLLVGGQVKGLITRVYQTEPNEADKVVIPDFCTVGEGEVCAFFEAPLSWKNTIRCWAWTDNPSDNFTGGTWPGVACTELGEAHNGKKVWKWTWDGKKQKNSSATQPDFIIFNNSSSPQTENLKFVNGGYYTDEGLGGTVGILQPTFIETTATDAPVYNLQGQRVSANYRGIYIQGGKKYMK